MYENANATPLATCTMNAHRVALPKTYHHFASCGAICIAGEIRTLIPIRSSSQFQTILNNLITAWWKSERSPVSFPLRLYLPQVNTKTREAGGDGRRFAHHNRSPRRDTGT